MAKNQFNVILSPELKARLEALAKEFGRETGLDKATKVAVRIVELYVERWALVQARLRQDRQQQEREIMESLERPPLVKAAGVKAEARPKTAKVGRKR